RSATVFSKHLASLPFSPRLRISSLSLTRQREFLPDFPFPSLPGKKYRRKPCRPGRNRPPCFCRDRSLLLFPPEQSPVPQRGNPPLQYHTFLSGCSAHWL